MIHFQEIVIDVEGFLLYPNLQKKAGFNIVRDTMKAMIDYTLVVFLEELVIDYLQPLCILCKGCFFMNIPGGESK